MPLLISRRLTGLAAAALFGVVLTLPQPAISSSMPSVTLFVFIIAIAALGIIATASAMLRRWATPVALGAQTPRCPL